MADKSTILHGAATESPAPLPFCRYPGVAEFPEPALLRLPEELPRVRQDEARRYRSRRIEAVPLSRLGRALILETAQVVADSFARREPQCRYLRPPLAPPETLRGRTYTDEFGESEFGPWTRESLLFWFIRLLVLTDATRQRTALRANGATLEQSLAILDERGRVIGGAFNKTMPGPDAHTQPRADDPFIDAVMSYLGPVLGMLAAQDATALAALRERYPRFARAHEEGRVGHHFMVARSDALLKADAFELVAASVENYASLGFAYMLVEATNQWTGAACEALGGVRVHYWPFRSRPLVAPSAAPVSGTATSPDGYLAGKDSGSMFYIIRIA